MASAAGMPLMDGALPPGTLTVRVVRGAFVDDLTGQEVVIDVLGGKTKRARTGPDGRVQFADLPIGAHVRASTLVKEERLESDVFEVPPDTGVRVLLVSGVNLAVRLDEAGDAAIPAGPGPILEAPVVLHTPPNASRQSSGTSMAVGLALAAVAFGAVVLRRRWWLAAARGTAGAHPGRE